jgi:CrcB protein
MLNILLIGLGGFIGAILRYIVSGFVQNGIISFPVGTLAVNTIGSFFLSFIMYLSEYGGFFSKDARIFLTIGLLGSFTTMSTFSYESFRLLEQRETLLFVLNVVATIALTLLAVYIGRVVALTIWRH